VGERDEWQRLLGSDITVHPLVDYRTQLCGTYRKIGINLNITSCQMKTAVNQRVFDIPLSGSFILTDNQEDTGELFKPEKEIVLYSSRDDLTQKIDYYLTQPALREAITAAARKRIHSSHTYEKRLTVLLDTLFG
jgi:spore maturation protein CgeB